jgi:hypothetical protein
MYNKLMRCTTPAKIESTRNMYVKHMSAKDVRYLNTIDDKAQYPGARCAMDKGTYMYQRSALSAVELMSATNKEMRACTAVDALTATLILIKLECDRFDRMKQEAWGDDLFLSPRGKDEYDSTYTDLFPHHYSFFVSNVETHWQVKVQRNNLKERNHIMCGYLKKLPMDPSLVHAFVEQIRPLPFPVNTWPPLL